MDACVPRSETRGQGGDWRYGMGFGLEGEGEFTCHFGVVPRDVECDLVIGPETRLGSAESDSAQQASRISRSAEHGTYRVQRRTERKSVSRTMGGELRRVSVLQMRATASSRTTRQPPPSAALRRALSSGRIVVSGAVHVTNEGDVVNHLTGDSVVEGPRASTSGRLLDPTRNVVLSSIDSTAPLGSNTPRNRIQ